MRPKGLSSTPCSSRDGRKASFPRSARSTKAGTPAWRRSAASPMSRSRGRGVRRGSCTQQTAGYTANGHRLFHRASLRSFPPSIDRKSVVLGKGGSVRVDLGGRRTHNKKKKNK